MSIEPVAETLLKEYERTAQRLSEGGVPSPDEMARYHGMTGRLLAQTVRGLWSKDDLNAVIDARLRGGAAGSGFTARAMELARAFAPYRWPAAIVAFSPFAGDIFAKVVGALKGG